MPDTFVPGKVDYEGAMSSVFSSGRALSPDSLRVWRAALEPHLARANTILDVGSGTGRFARLIAEWFGSTVVGIEPARGMRQVAARSGTHANAFYVGGTAEHVPLRSESVDAALLSNVYHHITNKQRGVSELSRIVRPDGRVLVRGAFAGRLGQITMFDYFPEARTVCERFPGLEETVETFNEAGFTFESVEQVVQQTCASLAELAARTRLRADTTLALLTDEEFAVRQAALEHAAGAQIEPAPVFDTLDLLVLRKPA